MVFQRISYRSGEIRSSVERIDRRYTGIYLAAVLAVSGERAEAREAWLVITEEGKSSYLEVEIPKICAYGQKFCEWPSDTMPPVKVEFKRK